MARREPQTLHQLLPRVLARLAQHPGKGRSLEPVWTASVGPHISRHSRPVSLENGTLELTVASPEWAHTLARQEAALREQLNVHLGPGVVRALVFRVEA